MTALIIAIFNAYVGYSLRDSQTTVGRWLQALNYISAGCNLTVGIIQLV